MVFHCGSVFLDAFVCLLKKAPILWSERNGSEERSRLSNRLRLVD